MRIDEHNCATITKPTSNDIVRLKYKKPPIRVIYGAGYEPDVTRAIKQYKIKQGKILTINGTCGNNFFITEFYKDSDLTLLTLALPAHSLRILNAYESYYQQYDQTDQNEIWEDQDDE